MGLFLNMTCYTKSIEYTSLFDVFAQVQWGHEKPVVGDIHVHVHNKALRA